MTKLFGSGVPGLGILSELVNRSIPQVGTTTYRPPYTPIALGALAGHHRGKDFRPTRLPPSHQWALEQGAVMVETGAWLRAQYYPRPGETDWLETVKREVSTVRSAVGVCDVSTLGRIDIQGGDAGLFLDRIYTNAFSSLPIGKAVSLGLQVGNLHAKMQFAPDRRSQAVEAAVRSGNLNATSVGFRPLAWDFSEQKKGGIDFHAAELLEFSLVAVPANQECLLTGMSDGGTFTYVLGLRGDCHFTHLAPVAAVFHPMMMISADAARLRGLPVHIVHGTQDWMFPPEIAQSAERTLSQAGAKVVYREIADLSHTYPRDENARILDWFLRA